ncbi:chemotaxis protein CheB [bacterium]|nr:chemotaxis protein CheB [bacterium]
MRSYNLVVIGASAGGPRILHEIFSGVPLLNGGIILVQHMPKFVNEAFCENIQKHTDLRVKLAEQGEEIKSGNLYVAPSEVHLSLRENRYFKLRKGEKVNYVCPSIDVTMKSLSNDNSIKKMGIILTGMGSDGAAGICHMKKIDATTIAQNEETSIVYGMPNKAMETGCIDFELSPEEIKNKLIAFLGILKERTF